MICAVDDDEDDEDEVDSEFLRILSRGFLVGFAWNPARNQDVGHFLYLSDTSWIAPYDFQPGVVGHYP